MSESPDPSEQSGRIFRAALPGWNTAISGRNRDAERAAALFAPGRGRLECSILLSALAMLVPVAAVGAVTFAVLARRAGNPRWRAAIAAALWCGLVGITLRSGLGLGMVP